MRVVYIPGDVWRADSLGAEFHTEAPYPQQLPGERLPQPLHEYHTSVAKNAAAETGSVHSTLEGRTFFPREVRSYGAAVLGYGSAEESLCVFPDCLLAIRPLSYVQLLASRVASSLDNHCIFLRSHNQLPRLFNEFCIMIMHPNNPFERGQQKQWGTRDPTLAEVSPLYSPR